MATGNGHSHPKASAQMVEAASKLLDSLSADQKAKATYEYMDGERIFWYYPPLNRHGLALRDMDENQRKLAYNLMATGLTDRSYEQASQIIDHEAVLGPLEKEQGVVSFVRDTSLYYFTVFGEPGGVESPWGWRVEGHHVSLHYSIWGDGIISSTPFFFGANPADVRKGPKEGLRILNATQDIAHELAGSLDASQKSKAIIFDKAPRDILTYNAARASLPEEQGVAVSQLNGPQREMLMSLCTEYVNRIRADVATDKLNYLTQEGGFDKLHFAWGGPIEKSESGNYYRIHGGNFMIEYDNIQNGGNHIHSVLRDVENDFANDVMREHLLLYHVL